MRKKTELEKRKVVAFSMPGDLLAKLDEIVDELKISRSSFILEAIKKEMRRKKK